ncbi:unnamed protein product [Ceratitis capitata]|uniref:(Mediterranean fruit fly) hypothetical protein n=1 Tax=Ceratitis capitata TaxID=7213 RepID=A0A811U098_CERCA|nr:unnamed protein product [Ceratitis capitata]
MVFRKLIQHNDKRDNGFSFSRWGNPTVQKIFLKTKVAINSVIGPIPLSEKHPQSITTPPSCFTVSLLWNLSVARLVCAPTAIHHNLHFKTWFHLKIKIARHLLKIYNICANSQQPNHVLNNPAQLMQAPTSRRRWPIVAEQKKANTVEDEVEVGE